MTSVVAPEQARERVESVVSELRRSALQYLEEHSRVAPLRDLLNFLRESGAGDDLISSALAPLLASRGLSLTHDLRVALPPRRP